MPCEWTAHKVVSLYAANGNKLFGLKERCSLSFFYLALELAQLFTVFKPLPRDRDLGRESEIKIKNELINIQLFVKAMK